MHIQYSDPLGAPEEKCEETARCKLFLRCNYRSHIRIFKQKVTLEIKRANINIYIGIDRLKKMPDVISIGIRRAHPHQIQNTFKIGISQTKYVCNLYLDHSQ